jgi:hypothetical protein
MSNRRRRQHLKQLLSLSVLGVGGTLGVIQRVLAQGIKPVPPGVHSVKGEVTIDGRPATLGQLVAPGATVTTRHGAEVVYVIGENAFLQRENSVVSFGSELAKDFFRVLSGKLLSVFGKGQKTLQTPTATIGIRGTGCYIEAQEKAVYFCLCYGAAEITPTADPEHVERIITRHHDHPIMIHNDKNMPTMASARVINHSDAELILLENLTGRWPPFYGSNDYYN